MKLYELPRNEYGITINMPKGTTIETEPGEPQDMPYILFYSIDGMFSNCRSPYNDQIHLNASTEIEPDGKDKSDRPQYKIKGS